MTLTPTPTPPRPRPRPRPPTPTLNPTPDPDCARLQGAGLDALHGIAVGVVRGRVQQEGDVKARPPGVLRVGEDAEVRVGRDQAELEEVLRFALIRECTTHGSEPGLMSTDMTVSTMERSKHAPPVTPHMYSRWIATTRSPL